MTSAGGRSDRESRIAASTRSGVQPRAIAPGSQPLHYIDASPLRLRGCVSAPRQHCSGPMRAANYSRFRTAAVRCLCSAGGQCVGWGWSGSVPGSQRRRGRSRRRELLRGEFLVDLGDELFALGNQLAVLVRSGLVPRRARPRVMHSINRLGPQRERTAANLVNRRTDARHRTCERLAVRTRDDRLGCDQSKHTFRARQTDVTRQPENRESERAAPWPVPNRRRSSSPQRRRSSRCLRASNSPVGLDSGAFS